MAPTREVAVVSYASWSSPAELQRNEVEMLMPVVAEAVADSGLPREEIGFTVSGSCDYLIGAPFSFVSALDAVGAWPPIRESHVEMDAAWALYEAWIQIQKGSVDSALVYGFGKASSGDPSEIFTLQLDPYTVGPLWPDTISVAALQARAWMDRTGGSEQDLVEVGARSLRNWAWANGVDLEPDAVDVLLAQPTIASPLRPGDIAPDTDGCAAIVLAADDLARELAARRDLRPAWITGIDHRIEPQALGLRDLSLSTSTTLAALTAGLADGPVDVAELHTQFSHEEHILREALGLEDGTNVNPSGGPLQANPPMTAGLMRIGEAAARVMDGEAGRAVAHATSGPCLQQNLVCVLEGEDA
ncbi:MAG: acetyl-CoA acetyltransferase [Actinomycetia bacterium]|nr:acetyl-CoA acetyltransferase [Actinomycetes bacterium]